MTPFALAFVLFAAGILTVFALPRRTVVGGTWLLMLATRILYLP